MCVCVCVCVYFLAIAVKNYAETDIRAFFSALILLDLFNFCQMLCSALSVEKNGLFITRPKVLQTSIYSHFHNFGAFIKGFIPK